MTALSIVQDASLKIGVARPDELFAGTTRVLRELSSTLNDCARMIARYKAHDWTKLKTLGTLTGNGVDLAFDLPADYRRMLKQARLWPSAMPNNPYTHYSDTDGWLGMLSQSFPVLSGAWTMIGDQIHVRVGGSTSPLETATTAQFYYISSYFAKSAAGVAKAAFTADDDTFRLDEDLLKLAFIYRWKQGKQQDYAEEMSDYGDALAELIGGDKGSNILVVGKRGSWADTTVPYPGVLG